MGLYLMGEEKRYFYANITTDQWNFKKYFGAQAVTTERVMRILHLISSLGLFGAETVCLNLAKNIQASGYQSIIGAIQHNGSSKIEIIEKAKKSGIKTFVLKCTSGAYASIISLFVCVLDNTSGGSYRCDGRQGVGIRSHFLH